MAFITQALTELGVTDWVLIGEEPKDEIEFHTRFKQFNTVDVTYWTIDWETLKAKADEIAAAYPLKQLRAKRDQLIAETDWWAGSDLTMTQEQIDYRQALRDITLAYSSLEDVVWPVKP